jgi:hypothetical protein
MGTARRPLHWPARCLAAVFRSSACMGLPALQNPATRAYATRLVAGATAGKPPWQLLASPGVPDDENVYYRLKYGVKSVALMLQISSW